MLSVECSMFRLRQGRDTEAQFDVPANVALDRPLRCLVIPGEDLLDVRALWRDVNQLNCFIRYLGFNESHDSNQRGTRVHVANNAVTSLPRVARDSRVLQDRFESIALQDSQALRYLKEYGPYHIVNLDLCGSIFPNTAKDPVEYYNALFRLLVYQFENQKTEWLLFITTMVEPAVVHPDNLQALCKPTRENYKKHNEFAAKLKSFLPENAFQNVEQSIDLSAFEEDQMVQLFGVALGKWVLALCQKAQPQWTVAMRKSFRYSVNRDKGAVMLSLAFALKPNITPPVDDTGMAKLNVPARKFPDERECAVKLAEAVSHIRDVDEFLSSNQELKTILRDSHADLLESAGYDRVAYLKWVDEGEVVAVN
jgi:ribosomal protein L30E